jgi:hypothetical protein
MEHLPAETAQTGPSSAQQAELLINLVILIINDYIGFGEVVDPQNSSLKRAAAEKLPVGRALLPVLCVFDGQECPSYW